MRNFVAVLAKYIPLGEVHEFNQVDHKDIKIGFVLTVDFFSDD